MIKDFLVIMIFLFSSLYGYSAANEGKSRVLLENNQEYVFSNPSRPIYLFSSENRLISHISENAVVEFDTKTHPNTYAQSELSGLAAYITSSLKKDSFRLASYDRVAAVSNRNRSKHLYALLAVLVIWFMAWLRYLNPSMFFSFILPFKAYTNSLEKTSYISVLSVLLPLIIFVILAVSILSLYAGQVTYSEVLLNGVILLGVLSTKWLLARLINSIFGDQKFSRIYIVEFLKYGIFLGLIVFFIGLIGFLNGLYLNGMYQILLLLYLIVWFIRLLIVFYRRYKHNILYFFSYLCATEIIPILFLVYCWSIKH